MGKSCLPTVEDTQEIGRLPPIVCGEKMYCIRVSIGSAEFLQWQSFLLCFLELNNYSENQSINRSELQTIIDNYDMQ